MRSDNKMSIIYRPVLDELIHSIQTVVLLNYPLFAFSRVVKPLV